MRLLLFSFRDHHLHTWLNMLANWTALNHTQRDGDSWVQWLSELQPLHSRFSVTVWQSHLHRLWWWRRSRVGRWNWWVALSCMHISSIVLTWARRMPSASVIAIDDIVYYICLVLFLPLSTPPTHFILPSNWLFHETFHFKLVHISNAPFIWPFMANKYFTFTVYFTFHLSIVVSFSRVHFLSCETYFSYFLLLSLSLSLLGVLCEDRRSTRRRRSISSLATSDSLCVFTCLRFVSELTSSPSNNDTRRAQLKKERKREGWSK